MSKHRPEGVCPPEMYYNEEESQKYTNCTRILNIQADLSQRCLELLNLKEKERHFILDIGCGSGISGSELTDEGHFWIGLDISRDMMGVAKKRDAKGEMFECDLGQGFNFRPGSIDHAISVSVIQWLCNADKKSHNAWHRLLCFFKSLYKSLKQGGRAVFQFYPENKEQLEMISNSAIKSGFSGGIVIDYPNSTLAKKYYLAVSTTYQNKMEIKMITGRQETVESKLEETETDMEREVKKSYALIKKIRKKKSRLKKTGKFDKKSRLWIMSKKERQRRKGLAVRFDTKYSGRRRKPFM